MPIRSCHGENRKREIIQRYELTPGPYCVLPRHEHVERDGCCGPLSERFFQFFYKYRRGIDWQDHRNYPREDDSFYVGAHCGDRLIELLIENGDLDEDYQRPRLFNPLKAPPKDGGGGDGKGGPRKKTRLNLELETVINLLAILCPEPMHGRLNSILLYMHDRPGTDNRDDAVQWVNDAVRDDAPFGGQSLRVAMEEAEDIGNNAWRPFSFRAIERVLRNIDVPSYIDPEASFPDNDPLYREIEVLRATTTGKWWCRYPGNEQILMGARPDENIRVGDRFLVRLNEFELGDRGIINGVANIIERSEQ